MPHFDADQWSVLLMTVIAYAKACFAKSDGAFDITSGRLRAVWDFSVARLPDQRSIDAALPFIGLDNLVLTNGQLHFRRPGMELDFGGLGKEYAADRAAEVCADLGMRHGFIDLDGDIRVVGPQPDGLPWRIGIRHPRDADRLAASVAAAASLASAPRQAIVAGSSEGSLRDTTRTGRPSPERWAASSEKKPRLAPMS